MLDSDGLFRQAATNFQQAEMSLTDAEVQLHRLRVRLEKCAAMVRRIPQDDALWQQVDGILDNKPADALPVAAAQ
jgi:hypothetical protein